LILYFVVRVPIGALKNKKGLLESSPLIRAVLLAVGDVHRHFKAKAHFGVFGFGPHGKAPYKRVNPPDRASRPLITTMDCILGQPNRRASQENPEIRLMIFIRFSRPLKNQLYVT